MLNQFRRIWSDNGSGDKDFSEDEMRLKTALIAMKEAADAMSRASAVLLDLLNAKRADV